MLETTETKQCPFCAETIKAEAIVCRFCGRDLVEGTTPQPSPIKEKKSGAFAWPGLLLIIFGCISFALMGDNFVIPLIFIFAGIGFLVYGMATGRLKLFG